MLYILYLAAVCVLFAAGMCVSVSSGGVTIDAGNLLNFLDIRTAVFVLGFIALALVCTRSLKPFRTAFGVMFGKKAESAAQYADCLLSVSIASRAALISGAGLFLFQLINEISRMDLSGRGSIGVEAGIALISVVYALFVCAALLPVSAALKRALAEKRAEQPHTHVAVRRRAGRG